MKTELGNSIKELDKINQQLAKLLIRKEELIEEIINDLGHEHKGQRSYECGIYKLEVKTPTIYCLNTALYKSGDVQLPENFNPIKESVSYSVDKKLCDLFMQEAPKKVRELLGELIDEKPGKKNIVLTKRVK